MKPPRPRARLAACIALWFAGSAVANTSARLLLTRVPLPLWLCMVQFAVACLLGHVYLNVARPEQRVLPTALALPVLDRLAAAYLVGFIFVNAGFVAVNVSLAETLRSAEPVFSVLFAKLWLRSREERVSNLTVLALVPIVLGGALASGGDASFNLGGLAFAGISNAAFAMRSIVTKQLKHVYAGDAINVFHEVSLRGLRWLVVLTALAEALLWLAAPRAWTERYSALALLHGHAAGDEWVSMAPLLAANALSYALYNLMSFMVLGMVSVVTHAVTNSMRRVFTILSSLFVMRNPVSAMNAAGMCLAAGGLALYSISKARDGRDAALDSEEKL